MQASIFLEAAGMPVRPLDGFSLLTTGAGGLWAIGLPRWRNLSAIYWPSDFAAVIAHIVDGFDQIPGQQRSLGLKQAKLLAEGMGDQERSIVVESPAGVREWGWTHSGEVMIDGELARSALLEKIGLLYQLTPPEIVAQLCDPATVSLVLEGGDPRPVLTGALRAAAHRDGAAGVRSLGETLVEWAGQSRGSRERQSLYGALVRFRKGMASDAHGDPDALRQAVEYLQTLLASPLPVREI